MKISNILTLQEVRPNQQKPNKSRYSWLTKTVKQQCGFTDNLSLSIFGNLLLIVIIWTILYILFHDEVGLNGDLFKILLLVLSSHIAGQLVTTISLPPLLGMLVTGIAFKTSGYYKISGVYPQIITVLRQCALCVILVRAGLGLDARALVKLSLVVLRLAVLPCLSETFAVATASHFIYGYPWLWGILLGFLLSAISPAVVVPCLLNLKERGYGEKKGIATLVIGASSLDDIVAISAFGVVLGLLFSKGNLTQQILQGPEDVLIGLITGLGFGLLAAFYPHKEDVIDRKIRLNLDKLLMEQDVMAFSTELNCIIVYSVLNLHTGSGSVALKRCIMVGGWSIVAVLGSEVIGFAGAGPLSCITAALIAGVCWKSQGWENQNPVSSAFCSIWNVMQTILFSVIGAEVDLRQIQVETIGYGVAIICCGLSCRIVACFIAVTRTELNIKERIFTNLAWLPKATVQAALAPVALHMVKSQLSPNKDDLERSTQILTIAVLTILITAPLGAIGVVIGGPLLLSSEKEEEDQDYKL